jgi:hypothetical protein
VQHRHVNLAALVVTVGLLAGACGNSDDNDADGIATTTAPTQPTPSPATGTRGDDDAAPIDDGAGTRRVVA